MTTKEALSTAPPKQNKSEALPLVYSCSGCSNIAQLANQLAVDFDRHHIAEMSCIAGVGGGVKKLVKVAKSGRKIIALDGCHLHCVKHSLATQKVKADHHFTLSEFGLKKRYHESCESDDFKDIKDKIIHTLQLA
jgi:uncharacterized metal-binding protein